MASSKRAAAAAPRARRLDGWGFVGERYAPPAAMLAWLETRLGRSQPFATFQPDGFEAAEPAALPDLGCELSTRPLDRLAHARGRGTSDLLRLRSGSVSLLPDAVARPADDAELATLLETAGRTGLRIIPWGGGTSVTGGVNVVSGEVPTVCVDLERLSGLVELDEVSGLATFGAGTLGPAIEAALAPRGLTLGHFPQSFELSSLGGWIATRSAGQESLGFGRIEDMVAGCEIVAPAGRLRLPARPASAAGPDLRHLALGSEGRLGIITRATVRVRPNPEARRIEAVLLPDWNSGIEATRMLVQSGVGLSMIRLSDAVETEVAMTIGLAAHAWGRLARGWLRWRGLGAGSCLLLLGACGESDEMALVFEATRQILRPYRAAWLGSRSGRRWLTERFRHPYLRDALLDHGLATETFETAAPWSRLDAIYRAVVGVLNPAATGEEREIPVLCHLSHPYRDGASLYFTFFFNCPSAPDAAVGRWAELKRRATEALVAAGGTLSHHHGVGSWHAPWLEREIGEIGIGLLDSVARRLDPHGVLNPHVLLDPRDRLEI